MERLSRLLQRALALVREHGPESYPVPLSEYLESERVTLQEAMWLAPRVTGFAQGMDEGFVEGVLATQECYWKHPQHTIDTRRN